MWGDKVDVVMTIALIVLAVLVVFMDWDGGYEGDRYGGRTTYEDEDEPEPPPAEIPEESEEESPSEIEYWPQETMEEEQPRAAFHPEIPLSAGLQDVLATACEENGVPFPLMLGLIEQESNFDPEADSGAAYGLCQLNRAFFPDGLSPAENIRQGVQFLGHCLDEWDSTEAALTAYNAGYDTGSRIYAGAVIARAARWEARLHA